MAAEMEFCVLGPLMVRCGGVVVALPPEKQRAVLAVLLLNTGHAVSLDELAEVLWGASPPPSARVTIGRRGERAGRVVLPRRPSWCPAARAAAV